MIEIENYTVTMENSVGLSGKDEYSFILSSTNSSKYMTSKLIQTETMSTRIKTPFFSEQYKEELFSYGNG